MQPFPKADFNNTEIAFAHLDNRALKQSWKFFRLINNAALVKFGIAATMLAVKLRLPVNFIIRRTVFRQFCGGETVEECQPVMSAMLARNVHPILDYGMEGKSGEAEFDLALSRKLHTIQVVKHRGDVKVTTMKFTSFCPAEILKKLHYRETLNAAEGLVFENARKRLDVLCRATADAGMQLFIDAEESWIQDPIDSLADEMMARYNADRVVVFNTYQLYRTGRLEYLRNTIDKARTAGYRAGVKIVRGAYVEKENERAARLGYVSPIQRSKEETDRDFNAALLFCLEQLDALQLCIATHNEQSCQLAMDHMQQLGIAPGHPQVGFAQLYGMGDHLTYSLAAAGYRAFKLIPYGSVREVIPYLLRRASENSSVKGQTSRELNMLTAEMKRRGLLRG